MMPSSKRKRLGAPSNKNPGSSANVKPFNPAPKQVDVASHTESNTDSYFPMDEKGHPKDGAKNWAG